MLIGAVDTSTYHVSAGIVDSDTGPLSVASLEARDRSLPVILPTIDRALALARKQVEEVHLWAVVTGPGSWTGVRLGVTTVKTLALATGAGVTGVGTLDARVEGIRYVDRPVLAAVASRKGSVFIARYDCSGATPRLLSGPVQVLEGELVAEPAETLFVGDVPPAFGDRLGTVAPWEPISPLMVARLAQRRVDSAGLTDVHTLVPTYLEEPLLTERKRGLA